MRMLHGDLVKRDCQHCLKYVYSEESSNWGELVEHEGHPVPRPPHKPAPCRREGGGCPKGTPEEPNMLTRRNLKALHHHKRCEMTGRWPDDLFVLDRSVLLRDVIESCNRVLAARHGHGLF